MSDRSDAQELEINAPAVTATEGKTVTVVAINESPYDVGSGRVYLTYSKTGEKDFVEFGAIPSKKRDERKILFRDLPDSWNYKFVEMAPGGHCWLGNTTVPAGPPFALLKLPLN